MLALAVVSLVFASLPLLMILRNLREFSKSQADGRTIQQASQIPVSVLVPARNEASGIEPALRSIFSSDHPIYEVIVLDDHSEDATSQIVQRLQTEFSTLKLEQAPPLPEGWNGKQHACWHLANLAQNELMVFLDADVRLTPDALTRIAAFYLTSRCSLVSGFPKQITVTLAERMLIPMMHFLLLGYLPLWRMRATTQPAFAAGCGQMMVAERKAYFAVDGHRAIRGSRHDGIQLPRIFRRHGYRTDLFDAMDIASCRMYCNYREVIRGVLKNADEGIANPRLIFIFSTLLGLGVLLPPVLTVFLASTTRTPAALSLAVVASVFVFLARAILCWRLQQPWWFALLHPISVGWFLLLQWFSWIRGFFAKPIPWRGRA